MSLSEEVPCLVLKGRPTENHMCDFGFLRRHPFGFKGAPKGNDTFFQRCILLGC